MVGLRPLNRQRAQGLIERERLDAIVLIQPESIVYGTGAHPGSAANWRRAGAAFVILPADATEPSTAIIGDFYAEEFRTASGIEDIVTFAVWVDFIDISHIRSPPAQMPPRPANFDRRETFALLAETLARRGLSTARLGTEHAFLPVANQACFTETCPDVRWSDASHLVSRLRMIKSAEEIQCLKLAAQCAEAGDSSRHRGHLARVHRRRADFGFPQRVCTAGHRARLPRPGSGERRDHNRAWRYRQGSSSRTVET